MGGTGDGLTGQSPREKTQPTGGEEYIFGGQSRRKRGEGKDTIHLNPIFQIRVKGEAAEIEKNRRINIRSE